MEKEIEANNSCVPLTLLTDFSKKKQGFRHLVERFFDRYFLPHHRIANFTHFCKSASNHLWIQAQKVVAFYPTDRHFGF